MKITLSLLLATTALALGGCVTPGTKAQVEVINENRKAIDRNTTAVIASGLSVVSGTTAPLDAASVEIGAEAAATDSRYKQLRADLEKQQLEFRAFVNGALQIAGAVATDLVPGGSAASKALGMIKDRADAAQTSATKAQQEGEAAKKDAATATTEAQKLVVGLRAELAAKETLLKEQIAAKEALQRKDIEFALKEFSTLNAQQKAEVHGELKALAVERGIKGAEGMSTEELLAALGAAGVGLAGLLRTFGRSRSAPEVEQLATKQIDQSEKIGRATGEVGELWIEVKNLQTEVAVVTQRAAQASDAGTSAIRLENHDRRISRLETKVG
jgi:hypothetical protein